MGTKDCAEVFITADVFSAPPPPNDWMLMLCMCCLLLFSPLDFFLPPDMSCQLSGISFRLQTSNKLFIGGESIISLSGHVAFRKDRIARKASAVVSSHVANE